MKFSIMDFFSKCDQIRRTSIEQKETVVQRCSVKKVFLEISKNSQENACARVSGLRPATLLKKRL